ncbi:Copper amine oxidase-like, N-terminal [Moorella glycerini]|uniref:Copper amine oxidase-like N-terminal domain-containing protein n=1 Tax=Neomoorella stamsii TaxID=1266720 RepID=A0A9X7J0N1_9FIRM|nr:MULTISPECIES: copper amine oxidase N-terminal domain-containing protein [Moorella]PRR69979.1 hypothetical protein MOST_28560 [Moorella stamsii]CEP68470.1 Copper amine oxidase-like, N-terminal [Moorella glycerini]
MKRNKKALSVIVILAFLLTLLPLGTAFAGDPVTVSNSVNETVKKYTVSDMVYQSLGWIKLSIDSAYKMDGKIYVTVELPTGVEFQTIPANATDAGKYIQFGTDNPLALTGTPDKSVLSVYGSANVDTVLVRFSEPGYKTKVFKNAASEIKVKVTAKAKDNAGTTIWDLGTVEKTVGLVGSGKVTATAAAPTSVSEGDGKKAAKVTLQEALPGDLTANSNIEVKLSSTKYYQFSGIDGKALNDEIAGNYGLKVKVASIASDKITLQVTGESGAFADKISFTPLLIILPGAPEGDISATVSSPDDSDIDTTTLTIATIGTSDVTASVNDTSSDKLYVGTKTAKKIDEIVLKSSGTFTKGDSVVLTLPDGLKWVADKDATFGDVLVAAAPYNDGKSLWTKVNVEGKSEIKITDATVKVLPSATPGDLEVTLSGTAGATGTVVVGEVLARVEVSSTPAEIKVGGLKEAAGDIVITETAKTSLGTGKIKFSLPSGFKFAEKPKYAVNNGSALSFGSSGVDSVELDLANVGLTGGIDTITISNIKYEVDIRAVGDVEVSIGGDALVEGYDLLEDNPAYDKDFAGKNVGKVVNAMVVSATKRTAAFVIGSSTYTVNGTQYSMDVAAYVKDGRTYLPVRYVAYALGVDPENIFWDDATQTVTVLKGTTAVQMTIGSNVLKVNGISLTMDVAPEVASGRTMLPFRFIAQALGASVGYDEATQTVTMNLE